MKAKRLAQAQAEEAENAEENRTEDEPADMLAADDDEDVIF